MIFIKADDPADGLVCLMPVGLAECSTRGITFCKGQRVARGDQLGMFHGGSHSSDMSSRRTDAHSGEGASVSRSAESSLLKAKSLALEWKRRLAGIVSTLRVGFVDGKTAVKVQKEAHAAYGAPQCIPLLTN